MTVNSGDFGLAQITAAGETEARYTALTMGIVDITSNSVTSNFGLTGDLSINYLAYNNAADGYDRLDWNGVVDFEGDGVFETIDPGAILLTPIDLAIEFESTFHYAVRGSVTGTGTNNSLISAGPISIAGSGVSFGLGRWTVDVDTNGNGSADLLNATLDLFAMTANGVQVDVTDVATLTVASGSIGLGRIMPAGEDTARYSALTMKDVSVSASTATANDFGLSGTLDIDFLEYNGVADGFDYFDWTNGVDVDKDGFAGLLNPGQLLPVGADLTLDFPANFRYSVGGEISGTGTDGEFLKAGPISVSGTSEFTLTRRLVDVYTDDTAGSIIGEIQNISIDTVGAGTFVVSLSHNGGTYTTKAIDLDASAAQVEEALNEALSAIDGRVSVGGSERDWNITFAGTLAGQDVNLLEVDVIPAEAEILVNKQNQAVTTGTNESLSIIVTTPYSANGTFNLVVDGLSAEVNFVTGGQTLTNETRIRSALATLLNTSTNNISVKFDQATLNDHKYDVTFINALSGQNISTVSVKDNLENGSVRIESNADGVSASDETQQVEINTVNTGTFTLSLSSEGSIYATESISLSASAAQVEEALNEALSAIEATVSVVGDGQKWEITFGGSLSRKDVADLQIDVTIDGISSTVEVVDTIIERVPNLLNATLDIVALNATTDINGDSAIDEVTLTIEGLAEMSLSGIIGLAQITPAGRDRRAVHGFDDERCHGERFNSECR